MRIAALALLTISALTACERKQAEKQPDLDLPVSARISITCDLAHPQDRPKVCTYDNADCDKKKDLALQCCGSHRDNDRATCRVVE